MNRRSRRVMHVWLVLSLLLLSVLFSGLQVSAQSDAPPATDTQGAEYAPDAVMVQFREGTLTAQKVEAEAAAGGEIVAEYALVPGLVRVQLPAGMSVPQAVEAFSRLPSVEYAEPDYILHAVDTTPNDPSFGSLWGMANIKAPLAWDTSTGAADFVVADIDSGADYDHPDLAANIWTNTGEIPGNGIDDDKNGYVDDVHGWDFAYNDDDPFDGAGHGTHTAGTIGAVGNNGVGVVGVNWHIQVMVLKFLNDSGSGYTSAAVSALNYAVAKGVKVSNNSWGGGGYSTSLYNAINNARSAGHLFIAAAGNNGTNNDITPFYPASYNLGNIISVAAIDVNDNKASFSNYGATSVDLGAPGVSILSTTPHNTYSYYSGTSMATPHVAGVAALVYALNPGWSYAQVRDRILGTVRPVASMAGRTVTGGAVDAAAAVAGSPPPVPPAAPSGLGATAVSSSQINLAWTDNASNEDGFKIERCTGIGCSDFTQIATASTNATSYSNTGLSAETAYTYRVRAYNAAGDSGYSNTASATTLAAPSGLTATAESSSQINLSWTDNSNNEDGFKIERSPTGSSSWVQIATVGANVLTYSNTGLSANTTYYYRVRAYNTAGNSSYSNTDSATTFPLSSLHIGDLDGSSTVAKNNWTATVTITVHDGNHAPVSDAAVTGSWSAGASGSSSCTTNTGGVCQVSKAGLKVSVRSVTFTVTNVTKSNYTYNPSANHDPDGDSPNGTNITVTK
jgi:serine protease